MRKKCNTCKQAKQLSEYYPDKRNKDGCGSVCKDCARKRVRRYYKSHKEAVLTKDRNYYKQNRLRLLEYVGEKKRAAPEATRAHKRVRYAKKSGRLVVQPCEVCGSMEHVEAHHRDYSKPLDVQWLCKSCHKRHHAELRRNA